MANYTIRIESTARWCTVELQTVGTWARGPGRVLTCASTGSQNNGTRLHIDDRAVRLEHDPQGSAAMSLILQLATVDERVALHTNKSADGILRLSSAADSRVNNGREESNPLKLMLYLDAVAAAAAGVAGGDPRLT